MQTRIVTSTIAFFFWLFTNFVYAGYGKTCYDFNKYSQAEQSKYLEGYTFGAAMEINYFKTNILTSDVKAALEASQDEKLRAVAEYGINEYLLNKYQLIMLASIYSDEFQNTLRNACTDKSNLDVGLFEFIPSTLQAMQESGKYPVPRNEDKKEVGN